MNCSEGVISTKEIVDTPARVKKMRTSFLIEFARAARQGPRLFFAPVLGAFCGVRDELRRIADENAKTQDAAASVEGEGPTPPMKVPFRPS